jgi:hypothetical protein
VCGDAAQHGRGHFLCDALQRLQQALRTGAQPALVFETADLGHGLGKERGGLIL